jgi:hypothetical protein
MLPKIALASCMAPDQKVLENCGILKKFDILEGAGNTQSGYCIWLHFGHTMTIKMDFPRGGFVDSADQIQKCRFPCAIRTNQSKYFVPTQIEVHIADSSKTAEAYTQVLDGE